MTNEDKYIDYLRGLLDAQGVEYEAFEDYLRLND